MHTQRRYATCSQEHVKKKMHTQRRYATCPQGMWKKREKDSPHPRKMKERDGSRKGVHTPSTQKDHHIHLHILIKVYDLFLFGSSLWLIKTSKASMPLYSYPELHISLIKWQEKRRQQHCLGEDLKHKEWFERIIWGARLFFLFKNKNPSFYAGRPRNVNSMLFHSSITQDIMVATQKFHKDWKKFGITCMQVAFKGVASTLVLQTLLKDEQRAKCRGLVDSP